MESSARKTALLSIKRLRLFLFGNPKISIRVADVQFCELIGVAENINQFHCQPKWVPFFHKDDVQLAAIEACLENTVFLAGE